MVLSLRALKNLNLCSQILDEYKKKYSLRLSGYTLSITRREKLLGCTKFMKKKICLNYNLLDLGSDDQIRNTIIHEIAHAVDITPKNFYKKRGGYHGHTWKVLMKNFGAKIECESPFYNYDYLLHKNYDFLSKEKLRRLNYSLSFK
jgi:predicted SprT family Zn-dependent metalloprotease